MKIEIKKAAADDIDFIAALEKETFSLPETAENFSELIENPEKQLLIAFIDGKRAGYIGAYTVCRESDIMTVAVLPDYRKMGVGRALVSALFDELKAISDSVFLEVRESNSAAIALYSSLGFERVGMRKNYYKLPTENAILYKKDL
ncbi:MAG: ribosomal protein S18-alanine N-acetyltransferase [Clostridia bacterium]|nr:ribosomal protein S18-alanine N-acetyltransferase [Clostridia bacterium]